MLNIKSTEMGLAIVLPYQDNANYSKSTHGLGISKGMAYDVLGSWSKYLQKILGDRQRQMETTLLGNINSLCFVSNTLIVTNDGHKFPIGTYGAHGLAIEALRNERWGEFLNNYVQIATSALMQVKEPNPEKQGYFRLDELVTVLQAADHDCID